MKPLTRAALIGAGVTLLALLGRSAGALSTWPGMAAAGLAGPPPLASSAAPIPAPPVEEVGPSMGTPGSTPHQVAQAGVGDDVAARVPATAENPVVLNAASESELRRLPGIGAKRASAILALRSRLGRFRAIEDLLKVKGIGRATLKRLRPLVRLDAIVPDSGA